MSKRYLTRPEFNAIIAGLRLLQKNIDKGDHNILTDGGVERIDRHGIDTLVEDINMDEVQLIIEGEERPPAGVLIRQPPSLKHDAEMKRLYSVNLDAQGKFERRIVWNLLIELQQAGFRVTQLDDGDQIQAVTNAIDAMELIFDLDECYVYFDTHWVRLVMGNGVDMIVDWGIDAPGPFNEVLRNFNPEDYA